MNGTCVETYTGKLVDLAKPDPDTIDLEDIAWHLSKTARFAGATRHEVAYSVAQHSVLVLNRIRQMLPHPPKNMLITALLHDAHEYLTGDITRPMKRLLDLRAPIKRLEQRIQRAIYEALFDGVAVDGKPFYPYTGPEIEEADMWACSYEAYHLMHSRGRSWTDLVLLDDEHILRNMIVWDSTKAYESFKAHFESLVRK